MLRRVQFELDYLAPVLQWLPTANQTGMPRGRIFNLRVVHDRLSCVLTAKYSQNVMAVIDEVSVSFGIPDHVHLAQLLLGLCGFFKSVFLE